MSHNGPGRTHDLAHLAHVELLTPRPEESLHFFTEVMGLEVSGQEGESVYLRGWDDYEYHTLKLTAARTNGMGHCAFRAGSPEALERRVAAIEAQGLGIGWQGGDQGHGPAYAFHTPDGHRAELYYETRWYEADETTRPALKNQASRFPARGANLRRIDHLNLLASRVTPMREFFVDTLGTLLSEQIVFDDGSEKAAWFSMNSKSYDLAVSEDHSGARGRLHHLTYAVDSREDVLRAADICLEHGVFIETGPHKHSINQTFFLYVYEPGGNRFEIASAGARLILAPDWKVVVWNEAERRKGQAWGLQTIASFHTHGTPVVTGETP
ncbi:catechol 2,3-dioxygenase [Deinococcus sp. YIM 134068]|uniref:catechol 2,3-dioxygenase n=1 Tax=Deinococcus lichenicola TaxID=3118910 RepID=UPI002F94BF1E